MKVLVVGAAGKTGRAVVNQPSTKVTTSPHSSTAILATALPGPDY